MPVNFDKAPQIINLLWLMSISPYLKSLRLWLVDLSRPEAFTLLSLTVEAIPSDSEFFQITDCEFYICEPPRDKFFVSDALKAWGGGCNFPKLNGVKMSVSGHKNQMELIKFLLDALPALQKMMLLGNGSSCLCRSRDDKDMAKKRCCSICQIEGHNSRTCNVRDPPEDNAAPEAPSEGNHSGLQLNLTLGQGSSTNGLASSQKPRPPESASASNKISREVQINKGVRWSPEEHMGFLDGIQQVGKGAWKAISAKYVRTRTANQISSHAQKYFKRMKNPLGRRRNPSIFDIGRDEKAQNPCNPIMQLCQIKFQPNNRLHPLPPSPSPGIGEPLAGFDRPSSGHGVMQIDEGGSSKDGEAS